jgi:glyoxylase-like metal-dependent hydrolase (beta-lactamase superfamily II)
MFAMQVIPQVYQLTFRYANIFLIVEDSLTLIDTGYPGNTKGLAGFIRTLGRSPEEIKLIILTHNHFDHTGGLAALRRLTTAKVAAPKIDFTLGKDIWPYPGSQYLGKITQVPGLSTIRNRMILSADNIDSLLEGDEELPVLGGLRVILTPGHTSGSVSLYAPQKKLLFVADAINKRHGLRLPLKTATTDISQAIASIEKMTQLDVETICFGHGRPITEDANGRLRRLLEKIRN